MELKLALNFLCLVASALTLGNPASAQASNILAKISPKFRSRRSVESNHTILRERPISPNLKPDITRDLQLSPDFHVSWSVYFEIGKIVFHVQAKTNGYVGFGLSDSTQFTDLVIGGINDDGTPYFADRYSNYGGNSSSVDPYQNWALIEVFELPRFTSLKFIRSLDTGDSTSRDYKIVDAPVNITWLMGTTDKIDNNQVGFGRRATNLLDNDHPKYNLERTLVLDSRLNVTWKVNSTTQKVTFDLQAKTKGYVGFGISKIGHMLGADIIIGGVNESNLTPYFSDRRGFWNGQYWDAPVDPQQNWLLLSATQVNGTTRIICIRDFDTKDSTNDYAIRYESNYFIWALGDDDSLVQLFKFNENKQEVNILSVPEIVIPIPL